MADSKQQTGSLSFRLALVCQIWNAYDRAPALAQWYFGEVIDDPRAIGEFAVRMFTNEEDPVKKGQIGAAANHAIVKALYKGHEDDNAEATIRILFSREEPLSIYETIAQMAVHRDIPRLCRERREIVSPRQLDDMLLQEFGQGVVGVSDDGSLYDKPAIVVARSVGKERYICCGVALERSITSASMALDSSLLHFLSMKIRQRGFQFVAEGKRDSVEQQIRERLEGNSIPGYTLVYSSDKTPGFSCWLNFRHALKSALRVCEQEAASHQYNGTVVQVDVKQK
ncbi:hypothetical protein HYS47_02250 [Candidatus Woesearchaeota archaeon]|nr:hypothetical protein [Candidatus Woesearchaeota archaeon]